MIVGDAIEHRYGTCCVISCTVDGEPSCRRCRGSCRVPRGAAQALPCAAGRTSAAAGVGSELRPHGLGLGGGAPNLETGGKAAELSSEHGGSSGGVARCGKQRDAGRYPRILRPRRPLLGRYPAGTSASLPRCVCVCVCTHTPHALRDAPERSGPTGAELAKCVE